MKITEMALRASRPPPTLPRSSFLLPALPRSQFPFAGRAIGHDSRCGCCRSEPWHASQNVLSELIARPIEERLRELAGVKPCNHSRSRGRGRHTDHDLGAGTPT